VPEDGTLRDEYQRGWKITDAMPVNVLGFQTHRDNFAIDFDRAKLEERIAEMRNTELTDAEYAEKYGVKDNRDWHLRKARNTVSADQGWMEKLVPVAYRPFDDRWGYFSEVAMDYPRRELMENVAAKENVTLLVPRQITGEWRHAGIAINVAESCWVSTKTKEQNYDFPLWLYPRQSADLLDTAPREKTANFSPDFLAALTQAIGTRPSPEDTLAYIYAILYSPSYRTRYADFLKRDFPRVPLTANRELFARLVNIGRELIALHTMQATLPRIKGFPVAGSNEITQVRFSAPEGGDAGRAWINDAQYFDGVPQAVWDMHIGGYRVAEKWLKDRKGRMLSYDDITHYQNVIAALARTLELQAGIDAAIAATGGWPLS